jgi:hypothetical protein
MGARSGRVGLVVLACVLVLVGLGGYALAAGQTAAAGRVAESGIGRDLGQIREPGSGTLYVPMVAKGYYVCADFYEDFSNPATGWEVQDDSYALVQYLNGEYRVLTRVSGYVFYFVAPTCERQDYEVEVDARWAGATGNSYGLIFGVATDYHAYYVFDMNSDYQYFRLYRRDPDGWVTIQGWTYSSAIRVGTASNHLKVTRQGASITPAINGTVLGTWSDSTIMGLTGSGVMTNPYQDLPSSDARFDNFKVSTLASPGSAAGAQPAGDLPAAGRDAASPFGNR